MAKRDNFLSRINRVKGQLKAIEKMRQENRNCSEILQQLSAAQSALKGATAYLLKSEVCENLSPQKSKKLQKLISNLIKSQ